MLPVVGAAVVSDPLHATATRRSAAHQGQRRGKVVEIAFIDSSRAGHAPFSH